MTSRGKKLVALATNAVNNTENKNDDNESVLGDYQQRVVKEMLDIFDSDFSDEYPTYVPNEDNFCMDDTSTENLCEPEIEVLPGTSTAESSDAHSVASWVCNELLNSVWKSTRPLKRWRTSNPHDWAVNVANKKRSDGAAYQIRKKQRPAKIPQDIDCTKCTFKCNETFTTDQRNQICREYWNLDFKNQKNFIIVRIECEPPKRVVANPKGSKKRRQYSKRCYFIKDFEKYRVCEKFFCKTLCISPSVITDAINKTNDTGSYAGIDRRGTHEPSNKTSAASRKLVQAHIESFPTMEPHYIRQTSKREYLDRTLSIKKMHDLYKEDCRKDNIEPVSEITYRRLFSNEYNLSFFVPKKDQCLVCSKYARLQVEGKQEMEENYRQHIQRKEDCNKEKQKDKERVTNEKHFSSVTFDLQAVLQIPSGVVGQLYYCRKICVYNLCIYESALPNSAYCFTWSEIHGKRGSSEIGSILYYYLSNCMSKEVSEISLFSDTCGGQNRNQYVSALLLWAVQKIDHLQVIEHKFLESGHSYMEVDSMHSSIESAKKTASVYSMPDYISIFQRARAPKNVVVDGKKVRKEAYKTKEFKYNEFYDLKDLANKVINNRVKDSDGNQLMWLKIKRFKYIKGETNKIFFNYDMSEDFKYFNVQSEKRIRRNKTSTLDSQPAELKQLYKESLPISLSKKNDLLNLCDKVVIPEEFHAWYRSLRTVDVLDRLPEPAQDEESDEDF